MKIRFTKSDLTRIEDHGIEGLLVQPAHLPEPIIEVPYDEIAGRSTTDICRIAIEDASGFISWFSLVVRSQDGIVRLSATPSGIRRPQQVASFFGHTNYISSVAISPDGRQIASGSLDGTVRVSDAGTKNDIMVMEERNTAINSIAYSQNGRYMGYAADVGTIRIWNPATWKCIQTLDKHDTVQSIVFSPDSSRLFSGGHDNLVVMFDTTTWLEMSHVRFNYGVNALAVSPDGQLLACARSSGAISVLNINDLSQAAASMWHGQAVTCVAFSPNGKLFASGSTDGTVKLWDSSFHELTTLDGKMGIGCLAFSPDGTRIAVGGNSPVVRAWDTQTYLSAFCINHNHANILAVAYHPDGRHIATGSTDRIVRLFDVSDL